MIQGEGRGGPLGVIEKGALMCLGGKIAWIGRESDLSQTAGGESILDAGGGVVMPGLIDCHTHIVHAGFRQEEFNSRSQGRSYQEIAAAGGGIMSTVRATRAASFDSLLASARERMREAFSRGITTIEIKTGYGLDTDTEAKMIDVIGALSKAGPLNVEGTFLGAHVVPAEYGSKRGGYMRLVIDKMLPAAAKSGVITACDVFVEEGAFSADEAKEISLEAKKLGLKIHLHVDQFSDVRGGDLAAEIGALSADHLDCTSENGMLAMKKSGVVGVILPGPSFFAGRGKYPDARKMLGLGLKVAIATDYNSGTNPSLDLWMAATIAVTQMGMTCDEALMAITKNAAGALGFSDRGAISQGMRADLIILGAPDEHFPLYRYGRNCVRETIIGGSVVNPQGGR